MARWIVKKPIPYIDVTVEEGEVLEGVEVSSLSHQEREGFQKRKRRLARERPGVTLVAISFGGQARWVCAPTDVRMHLVPQGGGQFRRRQK